MFPWTHAAFGYLLLLSVAVLLHHRLSRAELIAVIVATQLPDLVDKPLAWWFSILPSGRSLAHSLLVAVPLSLIILAIAWYLTHPEVGLAFGVGYASHLVGDSYIALYYWRPEELTYLLWPLLPPYPYDDFVGLTDFFSQVAITRNFVIIFIAATAVGLGFVVQFVRAEPLPR
ncbi:membrane-bound metal-dependent hydrolase [Halorubrum aidingense JCM 13560]|uniref:Membrane-bound metal-dependent hydrolase n=1 Tax=Halorubrum aidingense JCM 13560 TaxID=1230454 RepID=M0PAU4_9EURY|nr:metal-dependent hydrolase [Halorubrum aidingense]EMA66968.1 membrane-bound metal-dependent hydrolase [Halorubrum aidingense JCM 13560]